MAFVTLPKKEMRFCFTSIILLGLGGAGFFLVTTHKRNSLLVLVSLNCCDNKEMRCFSVFNHITHVAGGFRSIKQKRKCILVIIVLFWLQSTKETACRFDIIEMPRALGACQARARHVPRVIYPITCNRIKKG